MLYAIKSTARPARVKHLINKPEETSKVIVLKHELV